MRRVRFVLLATAILAGACAKQVSITEQELPQGEIVIALDAEDSNRTVVQSTKSTRDGVPDANSFEVEIFNSNGVRLYRDSYSNTAGTVIKLNAGDYRLLAHYGDSLGVGFDVTYFETDQNFTVQGHTTDQISATAKMANVKVVMNFGENLQKYYLDYYARIIHPNLSEYLEFTKDETRPGYIPAENLVLELYALEDGVWKYWQAEPLQCAPNDFITYNIDVHPRQGDISLTIVIDDSVETVTKEQVIPNEAATVKGPAFSATGFDENGRFDFIEAVDYQAQTDFVVMGGIASCTLNISSGYLSSLGLPEQVDLINADETVKSGFAAAGITWNKGMTGSRIASVDFSGLSHSIAYNSTSPFRATFSLTVTDKNGKEATSDTYTINQLPAEMTLTAPATGVFAKRISGLSANAASGDPSLVALQYSTDQSSWTDVPAQSSTGSAIEYGTITGLTPETPYYLRLIYNGNENNVVSTTITTEAAAQLGNSGFEDWYEEQYKVYGSNYHTTYYPYLNVGEKYWDTNNSVTTIEAESLGQYTYKSFPSVTYVTGRTGNRAAQVTTIACGRSSSSVGIRVVSAGRLFTGVYNGVEEISFTSRPDKLRFWYKLDSYDSDSYRVYIYIKNGDTVIGEGSFTSNSSVSDWTSQDVNITYSRTDLKAETIHVEFVSGVNQSYGSGRTIYYGGTQTAATHSGNVLTIDDLELIYE